MVRGQGTFEYVLLLGGVLLTVVVATVVLTASQPQIDDAKQCAIAARSAIECFKADGSFKPDAQFEFKGKGAKCDCSWYEVAGAAVPAATPTPSASPTPTAAPTATSTPTPSPSASATPTATASASPTPSPTATPVPACTDTDGGINFGTKGTLALKNGNSITDSCAGVQEAIKEYFCGSDGCAYEVVYSDATEATMLYFNIIAGTGCTLANTGSGYMHNCAKDGKVCLNGACVAAPAPSATPSASATPTATASASPTPSATPAPTATATPIPTPTPTPTPNPTPTPVPSPCATVYPPQPTGGTADCAALGGWCSSWANGGAAGCGAGTSIGATDAYGNWYCNGGGVCCVPAGYTPAPQPTPYLFCPPTVLQLQKCTFSKTVVPFDKAGLPSNYGNPLIYTGYATFTLPDAIFDIKGTISKVGVDDGCPVVTLNGVQVYRECAYTTCYCWGSPMCQSHNIYPGTDVSAQLRAGLNSVGGTFVDSCGIHGGINVQISGSYLAETCPAA